MKRKNSRKSQASKIKKPKLEDFFPIDTFLQNPGYELVARNIFKYLKLKDFSNCRLVCKAWKQFIDDDNYLTNVQLTEVRKRWSRTIKQHSRFTVFHWACKFSSVRIVKLFLDNQEKRGFDINAQDAKGLTPLHHACEHNTALVVKHLLNLINIDKNVTSNVGSTVFHKAAKNTHSSEPLAYLMENAQKFNFRFNINVNKLNDSHQNVFHMACQYGNRKIVTFLIQNGEKYAIDLNLRDNNGCTPFHFACFNGRIEVVKVLLEISKKYNINVFSSSNCGYDGQDFAMHKGHTNIVELINDWKRDQSQVIKNDVNNEILNKLEVLENQLTTTRVLRAP